MSEFQEGTYREFVRLLRRRMRADWDNVICIDGYEGVGKSTLALRLANDVDASFDVDRVAFEWQDWVNAFDAKARHRVYLLDEGGNLALSREAMTQTNRQLLRVLAQCRQANSTLILCMPNFFWLDRYPREHRVKWRIRIMARGRARVYERWEDWSTGEVTQRDTRSEFLFAPLGGSLWRAYQVRKRAAFRRHIQELVAAPPRRGGGR